MALAPGTTTRVPSHVSPQESAKARAAAAALKSHAALLPLAKGSPLAPSKQVYSTPGPDHGLSFGGLLHHVGAFVQGTENIYGMQTHPREFINPKTGEPEKPSIGIILPTGVAGPLLKIAALGHIAKPLANALPGIPGRTARAAVESAIGTPAGTYELLTKPGPTAKGIAQRYAHDYGPLLHGNLGEFAHRASMDPLGVGLDAFAATSLLAHAGAKAGLVKTPAAERTLNVPGTEGTVQPFRSPNLITAKAQHAYDRFSEAHPDLPVVGAVPRAARRIPFEAERDFERTGAAGIPFMLKERALLDPRLKVAYDVLHRFGADEPGRAAELLNSEIAMREAKLEHPDTPLIEKANQMKTLTLLKAAKPYVDRYAQDHENIAAGSRASRKLHAALSEGVPLANLGEQTRVDLGQVAPESAAARREQPARLVTGGTFREARLSRTLEQARSDVARIESRYGKASEARDRAAAQLITREKGRQAVRGPMTLDEAQTRLADLQKQHEGFMQQVEQRVTHEKIQPEEAQKLLGEHDQKLTAARERATAAEQRVAELDAAIKAKLPHDEMARRFGVEQRADQYGVGRGYGVRYGGQIRAEAKIAARDLARLERERGRLVKAQPTEPPLAEGHVRLYRGEGKLFESEATPEWIKNTRGRWFTDSRKFAETYARREKGQLHYVDLPKAQAEAFIQHRGDELSKTNEYVLPDEIARTKQPLVDVPGILRHPHDKAETARRNLARRSLGRVPTLKEELRAHAEQEVEALIAKHPEHPTVKRYVALQAEIDKLHEHVGDLQMKLIGGEKVPRGKREAPQTEPVKIGSGVVLSGGRLLHPRHHANVERLGGALSVAKDRVAQLEAQHRQRYGFLPEERHQIELVGGQPPGKGAAYVSDTAPSRMRNAVTRAKSITGKARKPDYSHQSRGVLFTQGRAKRSSRQVLRDFVQTSRSLSRVRDVQEATRFSKPLSEESPNLLDRGHVFFNPEGHKIPRRFNEGPPEHELEQMLPAEIARSARDEYDAFLRGVFVNKADGERMLGENGKFAQAVKDGKIRQIDRRIADAFEAGRYLVPDGSSGLAGHLLSVLDLANNVTRLGLLYLKGAFIPMNFGGNIGFLAIQQGPWAAVNLAKSARLLGDFSPDTLRWIDLEVGSGAALSISHEAVGPLGKLTRAAGHISNVGADLLPRRAAWIHEAEKRGVKNEADAVRLRKRVESGDRRAKATLNQISEQAEKAMVQFRGLHPTERRVLTRAIFIYPWTKGATRYLGRLPLDRPLQADLMAHLGQQGYDDTVKALGQIVSFLNGIVPTGKIEHRLGTDVIPVRNPAALTPLGTGAQVMQIAYGLIAGHSVPSAFRVTSIMQPSIQALIAAATHINPTSGHEYPGDQGFLEILTANLADSFAVQQTLKIGGSKPQTEPFTGSPASQRLYVQEGGWRDALKQFFQGGARERLLNLPAEQAKAHAEARESMDALARAHDDVTTFRTDLAAAAKKTGIPIVKDGKLIPGVALAVDALEARKLNRLAWAKTNKVKGQLTTEQRLAADAQLLAQQKKITPVAAKRLTAWAVKESKTPLGKDRVQRILSVLGQIYFHRGVLSLVERAMKVKGVELKVPS